MKVLISLATGVSVGCICHCLVAVIRSSRRPSSDFATAALSRLIQRHIISRDIGMLSRYIIKVRSLINEAPLPPNLDIVRLLILQGFAGLMAGAFPLFLFGVWGLLWAAPAMVLGAATPYYWVKIRVGHVHRDIFRALPECLDLLALVMQAGLDLSAGIHHYLTKGVAGPLRVLLATVHSETQMGRSRTEAFTHLAQKTTFVPLRDVCRGLVQGLSLGTSLGPYLREQSAMLRIQRMQIAEKKAAEAPLKILFPLLVFIFPTVFIVLCGPIVIMLMHGGL